MVKQLKKVIMGLYDKLVRDQAFLEDALMRKNAFRVSRAAQLPFQWEGPLNKGENLVEFGYDCPLYEYLAVMYVGNKITINRVGYVYDAISFEFNGCSMAVFVAGGHKYVAHVPQNYSVKWTEFVESNPQISEWYEFNPMKALGYKEFTTKSFPADRIWGVIDRDNKAYALEVFENYKFLTDKGGARYEKQGASRIVKKTKEISLENRLAPLSASKKGETCYKLW